MKEVDILRDPEQDVTKEDVWNSLIQSITAREWDAVILTPPCNTFSRSRHNWQLSPGPRPIRNRDYPLGFPWLSARNRKICELGNSFIQQTVKAATLCSEMEIPYLIEHPEDLGAVHDGQVPASIWQLPTVQELQVISNADTFAFFQCVFGSMTSKPTRFLTTLKFTGDIYKGWPMFNNTLHYIGPLPKTCPHVTHVSKLVGRDNSGKFATAASASYPPNMCLWIAETIISTVFAAKVGASSSKTVPQHEDHCNQPFVEPSVVEPPIRKHLTVEFSKSHTLEADSTPVTSPGAGPPMVVNWDNKQSDFHDGFGLCSPTRWHPSQRGLLDSENQYSFALQLRSLLESYVSNHIRDPRKFIISLALGKFESDPFTPESIVELRSSWFALLDNPAQASVIPPFQPFYIHAMSQTLRRLGDPDWKILDSTPESFATGVPLGYMEELPRTPLVFNEKQRWRKYDKTEIVDEMLNYSSAEEAGQALEEQFREEEALGMMYPTSLALAKQEFGDRFKISAQGAIQKPDGSWRPLHDATHGVQINNSIVCRDQIEFPKAGESATVLTHCQEDAQGVHFLIGADIKKAHRRVVHSRRDWGLLACRSSNSESAKDTIWINRVGTFGLGSIAYWWSRLAGLAGRLVAKLLLQDYIYQMIFADDLQLLAGGPNKWNSLAIAVTAWVLMGTPFSWRKFRGGIELDWVGYWLDVKTFQVGISQKRILWLVRWATQIRLDKLVQQRDFAEGLGRLGFASQVILWVKPFLSPLYAWSAAIPPSTTMRPPVTVLLSLSFIEKQLALGMHMTPCRKTTNEFGEMFRTDAKGDNDKVVLGGWLLMGSGSTKDAPWFSVTLSPKELPWAFKPGQGSSWASTSLELLASWLAVVLFVKPVSECTHNKLTFSFTGGTDNRANESLARKRSSTKFPLMFVLMQVSHTLSKLNAVMRLKWRPREQNQEADDLTNEVFTSFNMNNRIHVDWSTLDLSLLNSLLQESEMFRLELEALKADKHNQALTNNLFARHIRKKRKTIKTPWE